MRKRQELTRGARFSNARAKALRAAKAKPVQGPKTKAQYRASVAVKQAGEKLRDNFKKLSGVDNEAPINRQVIEDDDLKNTPRTYRLLRGSGKLAKTILPFNY